MRKKVLFFLLALLLVLQVFPMVAQANQEYIVLNTQNPIPSQDIKLQYNFQVEQGKQYTLFFTKEKLTAANLNDFILASKDLTSQMSGSYIKGEWTLKAPSELGNYQFTLVGPKPASSSVFASIGCYVGNAASALGSIEDPVTGISLNDVSQGVMDIVTTVDPVTGAIVSAFESVFGEDEEDSTTTLLRIPVKVVQASSTTPTGSSTTGTSGLGISGLDPSDLGISTPVLNNNGLDINDLQNSGSIGPVGTGTSTTGSSSTPGTGGNPVNITNTTTNTNQNTNNTTNNANSTFNISGSTIANSNIGSNNQINQSTTNSNAITVTQYVTVTVNGQPLQADVTPFINGDGRTMLPVRAISEALGAEVQWDDATQTATLIMGDIVVKVPIGQNSIDVNGTPFAMDTAAVIKDGRTLLPVRAVGEALGAKIGWDETTSTVSIDK